MTVSPETKPKGAPVSEIRAKRSKEESSCRQAHKEWPDSMGCGHLHSRSPESLNVAALKPVTRPLEIVKLENACVCSMGGVTLWRTAKQEARMTSRRKAFKG